ncbi:TonB-dependent receptor [Burkholderiaceae bacterium DAT-1]|nr:TonB-dependent receptor [Burkholderiaceae bacterium DAT-1]
MVMKIKYLALAVSAIGLTQASFAADAKTETTQKVEKIEVTGSNIKRVNKESVSPITTIDKEQISRSGAGSVLDLMRNLTSAGGNGGELSGAGSFRNGATSVNLRGLPTLVLLNGYRLPSSGSDEYSGQTSVDLNTIPLAAIDHIDVLKDGASAIYGTDAVGGVVNIILRKSYTGTEVNVSHGATTEGGGDLTRAAVTTGFGDRSESKFNVTLTLSAEERKAIHGTDRDWAMEMDRRYMPNGLFNGGVYGSKGSDPGTLSLGGSQRMPDPACAKEHIKAYPDAPEWFAAPNRNACMYAAAEAIDLLKPFKRYSAITSGTWDITPDLSANGQLFVNHYELRAVDSPAWIQDAPRGNVLLVPANNKFNTFGVPVRVRRLFQAEEGGSRSRIDTIWGVGSLTGRLGNFDWTVSAGHGEEKGDIRYFGTFLHDKLQKYLAEGKYNPFGGNNNSAQVIQELTADHAIQTKSVTDFISAKAATELGSLPGGAVGVAVGAEIKQDKLTYNPTQAWRDGAIGIYSVLRGIDGSQKQSAAFTELNLPLLKNLEAQVAARYDHYEFAGNTTNPKIGVRWTPTDNLLIRTTYSTGFRAPTLPQTFNEGRGGFASARDPKRCVPKDVFFGNDCAGSVLSVVTGTRDVKPEKSKNFNLGFVFEPIKNTSFGATYWRITWKDRIENLDSDTVLAGEDGAYKNNVIRQAITAEDQAAYNALTPEQRAKMGPLVGRLKEVRVGLINRSEVFTDGYDLDATTTLRTAESGRFKFYTEATYLARMNSSLLPDDPFINCENDTSCDAGEYQNPRWLAKVGVNWDMGPYQATVAANYVGHYRVSRSPTATINAYYGQYDDGVSVTSSTLFDASFGYTGYRNTVLRFGINNLLDRKPPFYSGSSLGYDSAYGNPRGRYVYGSMTYQFK